MSEDSFTEVTTQSWGGRLSGALKGIVPGIVILCIAVAALWWNEGRAVKRERALNEGQGQVISVPSDKVSAENEGKLVHTSGLATTTETLTDPDFRISAQAIKLARHVQMYQWKESSSSKTKEKIGGGTETTTTYTYEKGWHESTINSSGFKKTEGHQNPGEMPYQAIKKQAAEVTLGSFSLSESLIGQINRYTDVTLNKETTQIPAENAHFSTSHIYIGEDPAKPQIGDMKISFQVVNPMEVSLVSVQRGNSFTPFIASNGKLVELLAYGNKPQELMFQNAHDSNETMTWIIRLFGFIFLFIGIKLFLGILPMLGAVIPQLGHLVGAATGVIAFLAALAIALVTIAMAWLFYRPLIGVGLLAVGAVALFFGLKKLGRNSAKKVNA